MRDPKDWFISQYVMNKDYYHHSNQRIHILLNDDFISTLPFEIHVDDGVVEGFIKTNPIMGNLKFSNVTTDLLNLQNNYLLGIMMISLFLASTKNNFGGSISKCAVWRKLFSRAIYS